MKIIECTGSPREFGFKTKTTFLEKLSSFGYTQGKMTKKDNKVNILVCDDIDSDTSKMKLAKQLGVEIMTYGEVADMFDLQGDID